MANKKFLETMKNKGKTTEPVSNEIDYSKDLNLEIEEQPFGFSQDENKNVTFDEDEEIKKEMNSVKSNSNQDKEDEGFLDLSNPPELKSLNFEEEVCDNLNDIQQDLPDLEYSEEIIETPSFDDIKESKEDVVANEIDSKKAPQKVTSRRGRKPLSQIQKEIEVPSTLEENKDDIIVPELETNIENDSENSIDTSSHIQSDNNQNVGGIQDKIFKFVCINTIKSLSQSYDSKIYTDEFASNLFSQYVEGEINSQNSPLFKELIKEVIKNEIKDSYLGELTLDVLNYIKGVD